MAVIGVQGQTMLRTLILTLLFAVVPAVAFAQEGGRAFVSDRILVQTRGSGPDIILIPGLASTGEVWARTADRLDDRYRVHLVSIRGFGPVPAGANGDGALVAPVAAELRRYIRAAGLERPAVIGHSMGGLVALQAAADAGRDRRGGAPGRVMVVDATPFFPALISPGATVGDVEPLARIAYQALLFLGETALSGGGMLGADMGLAADSVFNTLGWQGGDRATLAQALYEVMTTDLRHRLPEVQAPVTVVYGWSRDAGSPRNQIDRAFRSSFATLPRPATFEPVEGAEHMVMIDQPRRFEAALDRFLR